MKKDTEIHNLVKRALQNKVCMYKHAVMLHKLFFYVVPSSKETSFWPTSMVYISVIITHITNHAGPSVWAAIHVLHSRHFLSWDMGTPHDAILVFCGPESHMSMSGSHLSVSFLLGAPYIQRTNDHRLTSWLAQHASPWAFLPRRDLTHRGFILKPVYLNLTAH